MLPCVDPSPEGVECGRFVGELGAECDLAAPGEDIARAGIGPACGATQPEPQLEALT